MYNLSKREDQSPKKNITSSEYKLGLLKIMIKIFCQLFLFTKATVNEKFDFGQMWF